MLGSDLPAAARFQLPRTPDENRTVYDAVGPVLQCYQTGTGQMGKIAAANITAQSGTEDCLKLSVYAPVGHQENLPVVAWIFGGGYSQGNISRYDPTPLMQLGEEKFVLVTIRELLHPMESCLSFFFRVLH